jgi:hypothetical protein
MVVFIMPSKFLNLSAESTTKKIILLNNLHYIRKNFRTLFDLQRLFLNFSLN